MYRSLVKGSYIIFFLIIINFCFADERNFEKSFKDDNLNHEFIKNFSDVKYCENIIYYNKSKFPIIELHNGENIVYYFYTSNIVEFPAYSGKPIELLIGLGINGIIEDIILIKHSEPILLTGIPLFELYEAVNFYKKKNVLDLSVGEMNIITGATVTSCILDETILNSSKIVAYELGIMPLSFSLKKKVLKKYDYFTWSELLNCGAVKHYRVDGEEKNSIPFIDLYYTNINPVSIGKNIFILEEYNKLMSELGKNDSYLLLLNNGSWSFKGSAFSRGGIYDRFVVRQNHNDIRFRYSDYVNVNMYKLHKSVPYFKESGLFIIKGEKFILSDSWKLVLLLFNEIDNIKKYNNFFVEYNIPVKFVEIESSKYKQKWIDNIYDIILYCFLWTIIIIIFIFKKFFSKKYDILRYIKFIIYFVSVFYFGFICAIQPSIVNVFAVIDKNVFLFLFSPLLFICWIFIFFTLFLWGRAFFCGWVCPFGALQELLFKIKIIHKSEYELNDKYHFLFRLFRYYILIFLFLIYFLYSSEMAEFLSEIEPFKTVWNIGILKRKEYEFVIYSIILILVSIFIYRFFCRYLCPLGAFLSLLSKFSLIRIKRRNTCNFCKICAKTCDSRAIDAKGKINVFECLACFNCINKMYDNKICPPLVNNKIWIKYKESGMYN